MSDGLTPPLKRHGGKHYLAPKIVALMPPRRSKDRPGGWCHYCEPYLGGGAVLLASDPEGVSEAVNDLDSPLVNFWRVLQHGPSFATLRDRLERLPFCQRFFEQACERLRTPCDAPPDEACQACALAFFVVARQSLAGRMKHFAPVTRARTRRGMNEQVSAWLTAVEGLPAVHERIRRVYISRRPALDVIRLNDGPKTLFYLDPPYLHETRSTTDDYAHEMTREQHAELLDLVATGVIGRVMLSGYRSTLYDDRLSAWHRVDFDLPNNAAGGGTKRRMTECLWCNFTPPQEGKSDG